MMDLDAGRRPSSSSSRSDGWRPQPKRARLQTQTQTQAPPALAPFRLNERAQANRPRLPSRGERRTLRSCSSSSTSRPSLAPRPLPLFLHDAARREPFFAASENARL